MISFVKAKWILLLLYFLPMDILAHSGHIQGLGHAWLKWIGNFHPLINHFPIALIIMTPISELFFTLLSKPLFDHAARFMILAAAITSIPSALLGFAMGFTADYSTGWELDYYGWHRLLGVVTVFLAISASYLREYHGRRGTYYFTLILAIASVILTGYFGGSLTFGTGQLIPPYLETLF